VKHVPIIWVEGLIASGKTTFSKEVAKRLGFKLLEEPVDDNELLEAFYKDQKTYAFPLQLHMMRNRYAMKMEASFGAARGIEKGYILDRCMPGDKVFAKLHWKKGNIGDLEYKEYLAWYDLMARSYLPPTAMIYLNCQPETAYSRMKERNRGCENGVSIEYLQELKAGYEELLLEIERGLVPWYHSVKPHSIIYDGDFRTEREWEHVIRTVADLCRRCS
jgi:deoxyadenosine/deoxycytidine kinase